MRMSRESSFRPPRRAAMAALAAAAVAAAVPTAARAFDEASTSGQNTDKAGVILRGYDVVAYAKRNAAVKGSPQFAATHQGATYHFASAENRAAFVADPAKYAPQFGGFCAMGAAMGKKLDGDPEVFRVVDGKLYVNVNRDVQTKWAQDVPANVRKAEATWPSIRDKAPRDANR